MADESGKVPQSGPSALHAPWRSDYIEGLGAAEKLTGPPSGSSGSFLRDYWLHTELDAPNHVIVRTGEGLILLNKFPYSGGHLLVALGEARARLLDYTPEQRAALWRLTDLAAELMEKALEPQGINIGLNQGRASGAGVPQHVHVHLVPRWNGDVNFMGTVGGVRIISESLATMAERYRRARASMPR
jgi:ATP adenylyltransferase